MDEKELNGRMPETDIDELMDQWLREETVTTETSADVQEVATESTVAEETTEQEKNADWRETVLLYLHDLTYLLAGLVLVFLLLFRVVVVSGTSMNATLLDGDYLLLLSSTLYQNPQPGDIIVATKETYNNGSSIIKRVIATEGQVVDIDFDAGIVYVDGVALDEPYTLTPTNNAEGVTFPLTVPQGCLFVMGDNRNGSMDSRHG